MAVEQTFTLNSLIGSTFGSLDEVEVNLTGGGVNVKYDTADPELEVNFISSDTWEIILQSPVGNVNTTGTITLYFTLDNGGDSEQCIKSISFTPTVFDCPPSALGASEEYASFVVDGVDEDGKVVVGSIEDCLIFVKTS